jgi:hypothetical protein
MVQQMHLAERRIVALQVATTWTFVVLFQMMEYSTLLE